MPHLGLDEQSLRERIAQLGSVYDRARRRLAALLSVAGTSRDKSPPVVELSRLLEELNAAQPALQQIVAAWTVSRISLRHELAHDVEQLRSSAAACLELVSSAEREYGQQRDGVSRQIDDNATRNRAVRAYSAAMKR